MARNANAQALLQKKISESKGNFNPHTGKLAAEEKGYDPQKQMEKAAEEKEELYKKYRAANQKAMGATINPTVSADMFRAAKLPVVPMEKRKQTATVLPKFQTAQERDTYKERLMKQERRLAKETQKYTTGWMANAVVTDADFAKKNKRLSDARKQLEQIERLEKAERYGQEYLKKKYKDNFIGQTKANYTVGRMGQDSAAAWNRYLTQPTEANRKYAESIDAAMEKFQKANKETLADDATLPWISQSFAQYVPQLMDQAKYAAAGTISGALAGTALLPGGGTLAGARAGYVAGMGMHSYEMMKGTAFKTLLDAGIDEETALAAANDEAVVSSIIEMGDSAVDILTFGGLSALKAGTGKAFKTVAGKTTARKAATALAKYGINIGSEGLEEGLQEAVSIGNARRLEQGESGIKALIENSTAVGREAMRGENPQERAQILDAASEGAKIAAVMVGADAAITKTGQAYRKYLDAKRGIVEQTTEQEKPMTDMPSAEQNMPSAEQTAPITEQTVPVAEQEKPAVEREMPMVEQEAPMAEVQKTEQQTAEVGETGRETAISEDLKEYSGKYYGEKGQEVYLRRAEETGSLDHTAAFNTYYRAGIAGIREDEIRQTAYTAAADKMMLNEAWMAGAEDRKAEIANAICGTSKLTGKRGLIVGEDVKATKEQLALASLYADVGGARIRLVDEISFEQGGKKRTANGYYEDGVITIALKSDSFMGTIPHEMIHYIRKANPAGYDAMRELVFKLANKDTDMEKHWANYEEEYGEVYGEDTRMTDIMEEMVADGFQKIIDNKTDLKEFLGELHQKDKTIFDKIKEFLEKMEETIKALFADNTYHAFAEDLSKDLENIRKLRKKFAEVLADTGKMAEKEGTTEEKEEGNRERATKETEAKFSLMGKTKDEIEVYETSEDIKKLPYDERMEMFVSIMENEYHGRTAKFRKNGNVYYARFAGEDVKKNIWGDKQSDKEGWKAKINVGAEGNIFELVENATYTGSKEEVGKRTKAHAGVLKWDYYVKRVQINGRVYDLLANVREKQDGEYIYNIGLKLNKKIAPAPPLAPAYNRNNRMATLQGGVTADAVNQSVTQAG